MLDLNAVQQGDGESGKRESSFDFANERKIFIIQLPGRPPPLPRGRRAACGARLGNKAGEQRRKGGREGGGEEELCVF